MVDIPKGLTPIDTAIPKGLTPIEEKEKDDKPNFFVGLASGVASGVLKIPEGFASLAAELIDLGADTDTASGVEEFFDKLNPFEEIAEKSLTGKIAEGLIQLGVPGDDNPVFSNFPLKCKLIKHLNSITSEIKLGAGFSNLIERFDRSNFNTLSATTIVELTAGQGIQGAQGAKGILGPQDNYIYVFGVYGGARLKIGGKTKDQIRIFSNKRGNHIVEPRDTLNKNGMDDLKIVLSDFDLTVKKLS